MVSMIDDDINHSFLSEETNSDGNVVGSEALKKGPWTPEEDAILTDFVKKNGEGNWNAVEKFYHLPRSGKSCRFRWKNYLRPDLKKGAFTPEEEHTIMRLYAKMKNQWARMAAELPGRTDNEIKNFINTRKKRLTRAGIHINPDDVSNQIICHESQKSPVSGTSSNDLHSSHNLMDAGILDAPVFKIEDSLCSELYSSIFPGNNMLTQDLVPSYGFHYLAPTIRSQNQLRESDASNCLSDTAISSLFTQWNCNAQFQQYQPYEFPPLPEYYCGDNSYTQVFTGSHALTNGTNSTSIPSFGSVKLELPSLQSSDSDYRFWDPPISPLPSVKCTRTDTLLWSTEARPSQLKGAPDTDGLLESVVCPSNKVVRSVFETEPLEKAATDNLGDFLVDNSEPEWEALLDSIPPMGSSNAAILNDHSVTDFSFDELELQSTDDMLAPQARTSDTDPEKLPTGITSSNQIHNGDAYSLDSWRPVTWSNANLFSLDTEMDNDYCVIDYATISGDKRHP